MTNLSTTECAVLGVLAERPSHGFALARELSADADIGRILTVSRPLVYRALDRLVQTGMAVPAHTEKGEAGPKRVIHRITARGRRALDRWLEEPVEHVRDIRIDLLLKLALLRRSGRSPARLVAAQRRALAPTLAALDEAPAEDHVDAWRRHGARAAEAYLRELAARYE